MALEEVPVRHIQSTNTANPNPNDGTERAVQTISNIRLTDYRRRRFSDPQNKKFEEIKN